MPFNVINGTNLNNALTGSGSADLIKGYGGSDTIFGGAGGDKIYGDSTLSGGGGGTNGEVQINQASTGQQSEVRLLSLADGRMLAIWNSDPALTATTEWSLQSGTVMGRYLDADGAPSGAEFAISNGGVLAYGFHNLHAYPSASAQLANGDIVVAWTEGSMNHGRINARILHADGSMSAQLALTEPGISSWDGTPLLAPDASGGFRLVYSAAHGTGDGGYGVWTRSFDAAGTATGSGASVNVNTYKTWDQVGEQVIQLADGGHVVIWASLRQGESDVPGAFYASNVYMKRYDDQGAAVGGETKVNTVYTSGTQILAEATALADGGFIVAWQSQAQDGDGYAVVTRRYTAAGVGGPEVVVNTTTVDDQHRVRVEALAQGGYVVVWQSEAQDGDQAGIYFRVYDDMGQASPEMQANITTAGRQMIADVTAMDFAHGGFVIAWTSADGQDGNGAGIFTRSFDMNGQPLGSASDDELHGGAGADTIYGQQGDDSLFGDAGSDKLFGGAGEDILNGGAGKDTLSGGVGDDSLLGGSGNDSLAGGGGDDSLKGGAGVDILKGNNHQDSLVGGSGADKLFGGSGDDSLLGQAGKDRLNGGAGQDVMTGGAAADIFVFSAASHSGLGVAADQITDFSHAQGDKIDLQALNAIYTAAAFVNDGIKRVTISGNTVFGDTDGNGSADFSIQVTGTVVPGDLIL